MLGIRHADGWVGYGGAIHRARYKALAPPGLPIEIECRCKQLRRGESRILARYEFLFTQDDVLIYESEQTAIWLKVQEQAAE